MSDLRELLKASGKCEGIPLESMSDAAVKNMAKAMGVEGPRPEVALEELGGGIYAVVPRVAYTTEEGEHKHTRQFKVRAEAIDTVITDLQRAKELLKNRS